MMVLIREIDSAIGSQRLNDSLPRTLRRAGRWVGVAVGAISALSSNDAMVAPLHGYHYALARGVGLNEVLAELYGSDQGCLQGRGGAMYLAQPSAAIYGANAVPGRGLTTALGLALAARLRADARLALAFLDERDAEAGRSWEAARIATRWELPLVLVLEAGPEVATVDFGLPVLEVDGAEIEAVHSATLSAVQAAREGLGPTLVRAVIDPLIATNDDPVQRLVHTLEEVGSLRDGEMVDLQAEARDRVATALEHLALHASAVSVSL
jgi:TPP-dependent pyruvate/acetoin dehydrogenase alpha subunit